MEERRTISRHRTLLNGRIAFNGKTSTLDCLVRNVSERGARIVFDETHPTPREVEFSILNRTGYRPARVAWRGQAEAGLEFI